MATLLATILTLGIMSRNSEITVMKSSGISVFKISIPILLLSFLISLFSIASGEYLLPYSNKIYKKIDRYRPGRDNINRLFKRDKIWYFGRNNIYNIDLLDPKKEMLYGITILQRDDNYAILRRIDAETATWKKDRWVFQEGTIRSFGKKFTDSINVTSFEEQEIELEEKFSDLTVIVKSSEEMNFAELGRHIEKLKRMGLDYKKYMVDLMARIAFPLVNFILPLIGIPFSLKTGRSAGMASGVGISIVIGFSYWVAMAFCVSLGHTGVLPPFIAAFGSNIIFSIAGFISIMKIRS
jgi:lipopolysaccharide export system permease protein